MSLFSVRPLLCSVTSRSSFSGLKAFRASPRHLAISRPFSRATQLFARTKKEIEADASKKAPVAGTDKDKRLSALEAAVKQIAQQYGKGAIMKLKGQTATFQSADVIPTGSIGLDAALGIGGLPKGRVVEIYGPEASGKTTLALHVIAEAQKKGGNCVFIDVEHALNIEFAKKLGVNVDELYISQPDNAEQALETADTLVRSGGADVIVLDSVAALVPRVEVEGEMGDQHMALQARLMSQALRKLTHNLSAHKCLLIFINQIRMKVGVMFGNPEVTAGGNALKFYSSVRLDVRKTSPVKDGENIVGNRVRVKVVKNKAAAPFQQAEFDIIFGEGISRGSELVELGASTGVLTKGGAWYSFGEQQLGQGKEKTKKYLEEHPELAATIEKAIKDKLASREPVVAAGDSDAVAEAEEAGPTGLEKEPPL